MKDQRDAILKYIEELNIQVRAKWKELSELEATCTHNWSTPKLIVNTIHFCEGSYGGSYDVNRWERTCLNCGKVESTRKEGLIQVPIFDV